MSIEKGYQGWTNYETWAVKLWMDNDRYEYESWREITGECWDDTADKSPNQFMNHSDNARHTLMERLKEHYDDQSEHPVFKAANGTVYADLLNAALCQVNWYEIAASLLDTEEIEGYQAYT